MVWQRRDRWCDAVVSSSSEVAIDDEVTSVLAFGGQHAFALGTAMALAERSRSYCRCLSWPDLGERWPSRLVATASQNPVRKKLAAVVASDQKGGGSNLPPPFVRPRCARPPGSRPKMSATSARGRSFGEPVRRQEAFARKSLRRPASPPAPLPQSSSASRADGFFILSQLRVRPEV